VDSAPSCTLTDNAQSCAPVAINQQVVRFQSCTCQPLHCSPHGQHCCLQDVDAVDGSRVYNGTTGKMRQGMRHQLRTFCGNSRKLMRSMADASNTNAGAAQI
jgi:hypothetical protein